MNKSEIFEDLRVGEWILFQPTNGKKCGHVIEARIRGFHQIMEVQVPVVRHDNNERFPVIFSEFIRRTRRRKLKTVLPDQIKGLRSLELFIESLQKNKEAWVVMINNKNLRKAMIEEGKISAWEAQKALLLIGSAAKAKPDFLNLLNKIAAQEGKESAYVANEIRCNT